VGVGIQGGKRADVLVDQAVQHHLCFRAQVHFGLRNDLFQRVKRPSCAVGAAALVVIPVAAAAALFGCHRLTNALQFHLDLQEDATNVFHVVGHGG
jgi:hypothetical protein